MFTKIRIRNFKCFQDTGDLVIRPLTFFVGPNSSGKSSIIQMLLMLKQTMDSTDIETALTPNDVLINMGAYPDFIYRHDIKKELQITLEFTVKHYQSATKKNSKKFLLNSIFYYNRKTTNIGLSKREIITADSIIDNLIRDKKRNKYYHSITYKQKGEDKLWEPDSASPLKFYGVIFKFKKRNRKYYDDQISVIRDIYFINRYTVENDFKNIFYLGPLRDFPKRFYVTSGQVSKDVGVRGENAVDVLWFAHRSKSKRVLKVIEEVRNWFNKFNIAKEINLTTVGKKYYYYMIEIIDPFTGVKTNLIDIGFGASQALPIIIESFYAPTDSTILIEQPEIHLHPKAQSTLGDLFINAAEDADRSFIIETHSEHILARIRRRIAEGVISKDKVAIYYFDPSPEGTNIREVTLNEYGQYVDFPEGFFEDDIIEAFEHLKAIKPKN